MLEAVTILASPAETPTTSGERALTDTARRYLQEATADATKTPDAASSNACPSITVHLTVAGEPATVSIVPAALPDLVLYRYCTAGWQSVMTFSGEVYAHVNGFTPYGGIPGASASKPVSDPALLACQVPVVTNLIRGAELLEVIVAQVIMGIAHDIVDAGTRRVTDMNKRLNAELDRYGLAPVPPEDKGASGAEGGTGQNPPDEGRTALDPAAAPDLYKAVRELIVANERMQVARSRAAPVTNEGSPGDTAAKEGTGGSGGSGGTGGTGGGGGSGGDKGTEGGPERDENALKAAAKQAEASYAELLGQIVKVRQHPVAPAVVELLIRGGVVTGKPPEDTAIQPVALKYLRDTITLTGTALPKSYPFELLAAKVAPQKGPQLRATSPDPAETSLRPELRATFWAMATDRNYIYEPLDDETLLLEFLDRYEEELKNAADEGAGLAAALRFQALRGMIEARDEVEKARQAARSAETAGLERVGQAAALLDLVGLIFPPAEVVGWVLGGLYFAGSSLQLMQHLPGDVAEAGRRSQAGATTALMASDYTTSARLLAMRPTVADFVARFATEMAEITVLSKMSRVMALSIRIALDLQALTPEAP